MGIVQRLRGAFPEPLEQEFLRAYKERTLKFVRFGLAVAVFLFLASNVWDYTVDAQNAWKGTIIRAAISLVFLATLALSFRPEIFFRADQVILAANCLLAGTGIILVLHSLDDGMRYGVEGIMLVLMYIFGFVRLLFWTALISALLVAAEYDLVCYFLGVPASVHISNNYFLLCAIIIGASTTRLLENSSRRHFLTRQDLVAEKARADGLILSIFPLSVAQRLAAGERIIAESHGEGTVLFADLVGFTTLTRRLSPSHLVEVLNDIFSVVDQLTETHGVEKIKTIGDAYMAVSGITNKAANSAEPIADFALDLVATIDAYAKAHNYPIAVRVGVSTGQIISGVIGSKKPSFDLWGDTVNLASRMESHGEAGCIQVNETAYWRLQERYRLDQRGSLEVKGIGKVETYFLRGRKTDLEPRPEPAVAAAG
jgi:adenylate cyclase